MLRIVLATLLLAVLSPGLSRAQDGALQTVLQANQKDVERASRRTIQPVLDALAETGDRNVQSLLENWRNKRLWVRKSDGLFFYVEDDKADPITLIDISSGEPVGTVGKRDVKQLKPNSGVRGIIASALVRFQLVDPDEAKRGRALAAIERDPEESHLDVLRTVAADEPADALKRRMQRLERLLIIRFDKKAEARIAAIEGFSGDTGVDARATLNPILRTTILPASVARERGANIAQTFDAGGEALSFEDGYDLLVAADLAPKFIDADARKALLIEHREVVEAAGFSTASLDTQEARDAAYDALAETGVVAKRVDPRGHIQSNSIQFVKVFAEPDSAVTDAATAALAAINTRVGWFRTIDLGLDGLSLASIYFLAAIGLAITFGVMGVINMAHGEFIMIGAYTGFVVQQFIPDHTLSILVALPLAFAVAFTAGVAMERLVIRYLMHRPLETLLATFGISIALQQLFKNIFGTQARPLTAPTWLDGAWMINDVVSISYIRIAIFVLALAFLIILLFILKRTRLGLEVRAVTQNPRMAASMGINPDRVNMLTFGLGSGIAGIAGVAIGLFAQVTSEIGSNYIVQSFMTVVVGGIGNIWGTLAGAGMIGGVQKIIEFFNPSNTLAAQTYMIIFIIIFIQFRPKGIIPLRGRAAED